MSTRQFRIKIRGKFEDLTADQRRELLAHASEHDPLSASFTADGHLSYDLAARPFFTFRFTDRGESDEDLVSATERAKDALQSWMDGHGVAFKLIQSHAEDMSKAPLSKRQRRPRANP